MYADEHRHLGRQGILMSAGNLGVDSFAIDEEHVNYGSWNGKESPRVAAFCIARCKVLVFSLMRSRVGIA